VPDVLLSGDHERVRRWRRKEALRATRARRPDLLENTRLSAEDETLLREIADEERAAPGAPVSKKTELVHR
jgi:tRNA (guanine37-N1)-methyltransferase